VINEFKELSNTDTHNCFACSPINAYGLQMKFYTDEESVLSWLSVPNHLCGWNNLVHGGVLSTILDEIMSWTAMYKLKHITVTRNMTVEFIKPVHVGEQLRAQGHIREVERQRNAEMEGAIYNEDGELCAKASGTFALIKPNVAKRMDIMDAASLEWFEKVINPVNAAS
jgi:uncharacterized protein (TIGR00369 family)